MSNIQKLQDAIAETVRLVDAKDEIIRNLNSAVTESFKDGARYALARLEEVFGEEVMDTDIWAEFFNREGEAI